MRGRIALLVVLGACTSGDEVDTAALFCEGEPVTTWDNFGQGFLTQNCQTCHASDSPDRHDAPISMVFDTEADVAQRASSILMAATGPDPIMPPEGGVSDEDRHLLEVWLRCYPPEP